MQKPVNVLKVSMVKSVSHYDLESGEVGENIQEYTLFTKLMIIEDIEPETIKDYVVKILDLNCIDFKTVQKGNIFEDSRLTFQTFEDANGNEMDITTEYFVDNDLYIEVNEGNITMKELQEIFSEIPLY